MVHVIGVSETTQGRIVTGHLIFPESIGLHEDPPALTTAMQQHLRCRLPEGVDLVDGTLAIVRDRIAK